MKRKLALIFMAAVLSFTSLSVNVGQVRAEEVEVEDYDYNNLETAGGLVDTVGPMTRGVYLVSGTSVINKHSETKIACGGNTIAAKNCKVICVVAVEKYNGNGWARVTSWTASKSSDMLITTSKLVTVQKGYKYRVRCTHYAASDVGSSCTDALKM